MLGQLHPGGRKALVQVLMLPLSGHTMPGQSHPLSELRLRLGG